MKQIDLFQWVDNRPTAKIYDWCGPFAARVIARLHEYDDEWPKPDYGDNTVVRMPPLDDRKRA